MLPRNPGFAQAVRARFDRQGAMARLGARLARIDAVAHAAGREKRVITAPQTIMQIAPFAARAPA